MSNAHPANSPDGFEPVPVNPRAGGWTPDKQAAFIEALGATACVTTAAAAVGMSRESAYKLRARADEAFREAWEAALGYGVVRLDDAALDRALNGVPVPIFYKGEKVGERRHFDERLTMFLLRTRDPMRNLSVHETIGLEWDISLESIAQRLHDAIAALFGRRRPSRRDFKP